MKKALILYACYGGGHISAANSIKECIEKYYPDIEPITIDFMNYLNVTIDKLTTTAYEEMAKKAPALWGTVYMKSEKGALARFSIDSNKLLAIKLHFLIKRYKPDYIISTHPFSSQMCAYLKKKNKLPRVKLATVMTDFAPHDQWLVGSDYINHFFVAHEAMKELLVNKGISEKKVFATGIPLSNRFFLDYDKDALLNDFDLSKDKFTILFFAGGRFGLGKKNTYKILEDIARYMDNVQVVAIAGKNKKMFDAFNDTVKKYKRKDDIKVLEFTDKVPELMHISDIVISKPGGLTTSECLACGLPMIVINPIPGQEEQNAEFLENSNLAYWIKDDDNPLGVIFKVVNNKNILDGLKQNVSKYTKRNSTKEICEVLFDFS
ncbi:MAG: glycosyltransferase [Clostridia bacterium]|nr:glycosyltransferase [Clostridia bacterium]